MCNLRRSFVAAVSAAALTAACQQPQEPAALNDLAATNSMNQTNEAARGVQLVDASGTDIGRVFMREDANGMTFELIGESLPEGTHGVHLHEKGLCEPPFVSAGAHWNPMSKLHGRNNPMGAHLGDLENVDTPAETGFKKLYTIQGVWIRGDEANKIYLADADGTSLVIHADADDYKTDPSGNSGARIACAVLAK